MGKRALKQVSMCDVAVFPPARAPGSRRSCRGVRLRGSVKEGLNSCSPTIRYTVVRMNLMHPFRIGRLRDRVVAGLFHTEVGSFRGLLFLPNLC